MSGKFSRQRYVKRTRYAKKKAKIIKNREWIYKLKTETPCADCKQHFPPYVMEFDHRVPAEKRWDISHIYHKSPVTIKAEIDKCDIVCSNCHQIRTYVSQAHQRGGLISVGRLESPNAKKHEAQQLQLFEPCLA